MQGVSIENLQIETDNLLTAPQPIQIDVESIKRKVRSSLINVGKRWSKQRGAHEAR
jgi:hypothetical protein